MDSNPIVHLATFCIGHLSASCTIEHRKHLLKPPWPNKTEGSGAGHPLRLEIWRLFMFGLRKNSSSASVAC